MSIKPADGARCHAARENFFLSVNSLTPFDRFLNQAAECGRIGRPSDEYRLTNGEVI
jgi:hypothetical protein